MKFKNLLVGAFFVGILSVLYNYLIFRYLNFYPDLHFGLEFLKNWGLNFYAVIFIKNFVVGLLLMLFFTLAYRNIVADTGEIRYTLKATLFFILYAIFAFAAFSIGDIFLMKTQEGMLILLTVDGIIETIIATIPVRIFSKWS